MGTFFKDKNTIVPFSTLSFQFSEIPSLNIFIKSQAITQK